MNWFVRRFLSILFIGLIAATSVAAGTFVNSNDYNKEIFVPYTGTFGIFVNANDKVGLYTGESLMAGYMNGATTPIAPADTTGYETFIYDSKSGMDYDDFVASIPKYDTDMNGNNPIYRYNFAAIVFDDDWANNAHSRNGYDSLMLNLEDYVPNTIIPKGKEFMIVISISPRYTVVGENFLYPVLEDDIVPDEPSEDLPNPDDYVDDDGHVHHELDDGEWLVFDDMDEFLEWEHTHNTHTGELSIPLNGTGVPLGIVLLVSLVGLMVYRRKH